MQAQLASIIADAEAVAPSIANRPDFEAFKARLVGPNGSLTGAMKAMAAVPKEEKPVVGKLINQTKSRVEAVLAETLHRVEDAELLSKLGPAVDVSLPVVSDEEGLRHPLTQTRERIVGVFRKLGFTVADGPEIESEWTCFDALGTPPDHPARDMQDTLYMPKSFVSKESPRRADEELCLRTHTSSVQIRTMLAAVAAKAKSGDMPPVRIVAPGRCFRRDTVDATHSANFHQVEGLWVGRDVTLRDLKSVLDAFVKETFGSKVQIRFRPSYFPFTEPSFEMDIKVPDMGRLSDRWLEIMGCGLVDPKVFENVGIDPDEYTGLAFGMGVERIAMLQHGIDDIRHFYANDLRFLRQFA